MGKGFNNYMSKKDFHPSAIWNLKRVFMAEQKLAMEKKKQDELRTQYEKEQDIVNNKALLGDEKAKIGLAFMYDAPAGIRKEEKTADPTTEPKFEWQRKYNAPREAWAKGDDAVQDQPFGIQVRNVRCVKCHTWGHVNTDSECPLYNMSGSKENPGVSTNPSDIIRELRKSKGQSTMSSAEAGDKKKEHMTSDDLMTEMKTEYGLTLKKHVLDQFHTDEKLEKLGHRADVKAKETSTSTSLMLAFFGGGGESGNDWMFNYLKSCSDKERAKIFKKFFDSEAKKEKKSKEGKEEKKKRRDSSDEDRRQHRTKKETRSERETKEESRKRHHRKRHDTSSEEERSPLPPRKKHRSHK